MGISIYMITVAIKLFYNLFGILSNTTKLYLLFLWIAHTLSDNYFFLSVNMRQSL